MTRPAKIDHLDIDIFENYLFEMFNVIYRAMKMQSGKADLAVYSYSVG